MEDCQYQHQLNQSMIGITDRAGKQIQGSKRFRWRTWAGGIILGLFILSVFVALRSQKAEKKDMVATAYCECCECCGWERGNPKYWRLDFWNRYVSEGSRVGARYTGRSASGARLRQYDPGIFFFANLVYPWRIPLRLLFPWRLFPRDGAIAADTAYYSFGTRMYVPGYGWGIVEDRGGAIRGPDRIDVFFRSHKDTLRWGRRQVTVSIFRRRTKKFQKNIDNMP